MKRILPLIMILALLLCACAKTPTQYTLTVSGVELTVNTDQSTISDGTNLYTYLRLGMGIENQMTYSTTIRYPNGSTWKLEEEIVDGSCVSSTVDTSADYDSVRYPSGENLMVALRWALEQKAEVEAKKPDVDWPLFALGAILLVLGVLSLIFPDTMWDLSTIFQRWRYRDMDPTEEGMEFFKATSTIEVVAGIILLLVSFGG